LNVYVEKLMILHTPDTDDIVGVSSVKSLTITAPRKRNTLGVGSKPLGEVGKEIGNSFVQVGNEALGIQVPDLDGRAGSRAEPVTVRGEDESVDDVSGFERAKVLTLIQVPQHGDAVLSTRSTEGTVRGDSHGVDVTRVTGQVGNQFAVLEVPDLRIGKEGKE